MSVVLNKLKQSINTAMVSPENLNEDGSVNWSFVDADAYHDCIKLYASVEGFYKDFDRMVTEIRNN